MHFLRKISPAARWVGSKGRFRGMRPREKAPEEAVSRVPCAAGDPPRGGHFSTTRVAARLERPGPEGLGRAALIPRAKRTARGNALLFGLAPGGVCRAAAVARRAVSSYLTISPLPPAGRREAVCFLWRCPRGRPHRVLPGTLPCGARTFLPPRSGAGGRLASSGAIRDAGRSPGSPEGRPSGSPRALHAVYGPRGTPATGGRPRRTAAEGAPTSPCISR